VEKISQPGVFQQPARGARQLKGKDFRQPNSFCENHKHGWASFGGIVQLALLMCRQLLAPTRYEMEVLADEALTSEVVDQVAEKVPALICIVSLPPGGLAQTRYLCKRLRVRFPDARVLVVRLGTQTANHRDSLLDAGADKVATTIVELRDQVSQISQIVSVEA
jgi:DNA-binding NarL/FixJ family response regulator